VFSTGSSLRWMREQVCRNLDSEAERRKISIYELMIEKAAQSPMGARGVMFLPTLAGGSSLDPSPNVRGAFVQIELGTTQDDLCRAGLEGISMAQAEALRALESLAPLSDEILAVGGGSASDFWMQIYADMYGKCMVRSQVGQQAAALGAAATAFVGIGEWRDYQPMASIHLITDRRKPIGANTEFYAKRASLFRKLNRSLSEIGDRAAEDTRTPPA
jgi:xylulokinase